MALKSITKYGRILGTAFISLILALTPLSAARADDTTHITGTITDKTSAAVEGAEITATAPGNQAVLFGPAISDSNGNYDLAVTTGAAYELHVAGPAEATLYPHIVPGTTYSGLAYQVDVQLLPAHTLSGVVLDGNDDPVANLHIWFVNRDTALQSAELLTDGGGAFSTQLEEGSYDVGAYNYGTATNVPQNLSVLGDSQSLIEVTDDTVQDLKFDTVITTIALQDQLSAPVATGTTVTATYASGSFALVEGQSATFEPNALTQTASFDGASSANLALIAGLTYHVCATFDTNSTTLCQDVTPTVSSTTTLTKPQTYVYSGTLRDNNGTALAGALLRLRSANRATSFVTTAGDGTFSIEAMPDQYEVGLVDYLATILPTINYLTSTETLIDMTNGNVSHDLQVQTANVPISVLDQNEAPLANKNIHAEYLNGTTGLISGQGATFAPVTLYNDAMSNQSGNATTTLLRGLTYRICVESTTCQDVTITDETPLVFHLTQ